MSKPLQQSLAFWAVQFGVSRSTVCRWFKRAGMDPGNDGATLIDVLTARDWTPQDDEPSIAELLDEMDPDYVKFPNRPRRRP